MGSGGGGLAIPTMPATAVRDRRSLEDYLSQSLWEDYHERTEGRTRRISTSLKTYLVEVHAENFSRQPESLAGFTRFEPVDDPLLWRAWDHDGGAYFFDFTDERFALLHTIELTNRSDMVVDRFVTQSKAVDRCWFSTALLTGLDFGQVIGFRFLHQRDVSGLADSEEATILAQELGKEQPPPFRLSVTEYIGAQHDLYVLRHETTFGPRSSVNSMTWRSRNPINKMFIHNELWATGKMSGYGTSWDRHLANALQARDKYRRLVANLEGQWRIRWDDNGLMGQPIEIRFPIGLISDVPKLAAAIASGTYPFRIWGLTTRLGPSTVSIDGLDLHTNDRLELELTPRRLLVYLRRETCGNVVPRLLVNLEQHVSAELKTSLSEAELGLG